MAFSKLPATFCLFKKYALELWLAHVLYCSVCPAPTFPNSACLILRLRISISCALTGSSVYIRFTIYQNFPAFHFTNIWVDNQVSAPQHSVTMRHFKYFFIESKHFLDHWSQTNQGQEDNGKFLILLISMCLVSINQYHLVVQCVINRKMTIDDVSAPPVLLNC